MKKILFIICLFISTMIYGQNSYDRQLKYWYLRDRLRYFIVKSDEPLNNYGSFLVMTSRNRNWTAPLNHYFTDRADYGQQMALFGKYLGVLATEYRLLVSSGRIDEADNTNRELLKVLKAFERLDLCESNLNPPLPLSIHDGFFIRHDVPEDNGDGTNTFLLNSNVNIDAGILLPWDILLKDNEIRPVTIVNGVNPMTPINEYMSQDEAVFLLEGLALAFKFGSLEVQLIAQAHARNVLHRLYGYVSPLLHTADWILHDPYGLPIPDAEGGNCRALSFGYCKIAHDFFGFHEFIPFPGSETIWLSLFNGISGGYNAHMIASIAAIGEGWGNFIAHQTQHGIYNNTDQDGWDYYYLWLYKALWDRSWSLYDVDRIEDRLDEAPCQGPFFENFENHPPNGWSSPDKWRYSLAQQYADVDVGDVGIYSGLDYMILLNLYYINNGGGLAPYRNYISTNQDNDWPNGTQGSVNEPYFLGLFRNISTTDHLRNSPIAAHVNYRAGVSVTLLPGFKSELGTRFLADIQNMDYCNNKSLLDITSTYPAINTLKEISNIPKLDYDKQLINSSLEVNKNNFLQNKIIVFPNPSNGIFTIENGLLYKKYKIISFYGEQIMSGNIINNTFSIDLSKNESGLYIIIFESDNSFYRQKLSLIH